MPPIEKPPIEVTIAALEAEDAALAEAVRAAEVRRTRINAALAALRALMTDEPIEFEGKLSDACREVLRRSAGRSLTPIEVRDQLRTIGYDMSGHKNIMASVHSVLKRLAEGQKEIRSKESKDGGTKYFWVVERPITSQQIAQQAGATLASMMAGRSQELLDELAKFSSSTSAAMANSNFTKLFGMFDSNAIKTVAQGIAEFEKLHPELMKASKAVK